MSDFQRAYDLGIDLGTTYTAAAIDRNGRCEIVPLGNRAAVIPSVVLLAEDGTDLVGEPARRRALTEPTRVVREFKRRLGDPTPILVAGSPISAESLMARLTRAVVAQVAEREGGPARHVTVTHPANWGAFKQDLLRQALRMADLDDVGLLTEPEAAAWAYADAERLDEGATVAVYDLGGGTFDAAVLRRTADGFRILGQPEGIERLGGIDFDQAVYALVAGALGGALQRLDDEDPAVLAAAARLREECVEAKEALSADAEVTVPVLLPDLSTEVRITRAEFERLIRPSLGDTIGALHRAVRSAGITPAELDAVLLVGGSARIPLVAQLVTAELGRPVAVDAHPKHGVAMGAARHAAARGPRAAAPAPPPVAPAAAAVVPPVAPPPVEAPPVAPPPVEAPPVAPPPVEAPPPVAPQPVATPPAAPAPPSREAVPDPVPAPGPAPSGSTPRAAAPAPTAGSAGTGRSRVPGLVGAVAVAAVVAVVGAVLLLGGGGGDDVSCPDEGPFVCITDVDLRSDGSVLATFDPVEVNVGQDANAVFFLVDQVRETPEASAAAAGAALQWQSNQPFEGWDDGQTSGRAGVCVLLFDGANLLAGTGNCVGL